MHNYLIDTSIILDDISNISQLSSEGDNNLYITDVVLKELDSKKDLPNDIGFFARSFFRGINAGEIAKAKDKRKKSQNLVPLDGDKILDLYFLDNKEGKESLIPLNLIVREKYLTKEVIYSLNDKRIIEIAKDYNLTLLSNDIALRSIAKSFSVATSMLVRDLVDDPRDIDFWYHCKLHVNDDITATEGFKALKNFTLIKIELLDNTQNSLYLTGQQKYGIKYSSSFVEFNFDEIINIYNPYIRPLNIEQKMLYALLTYKNNNITIATGRAGSGKTLLALNAGITLLKNKIVDGIVYIRNTVTSTDKESELGFRKGDEDQKLGYFMYPLYCAINFIIGKLQNEQVAKQIEYGLKEINSIEKQDATNYFIAKHNIEIMDIAHARGTTISKKFVIFDEVQNAPKAMLKLIGSRIGEGSKIVMLGDFGQIDHPYLNKFRNGATIMLNAAISGDEVSGIQLNNVIRSSVAKFFDEYL